MLAVGTPIWLLPLPKPSTTRPSSIIGALSRYAGGTCTHHAADSLTCSALFCNQSLLRELLCHMSRLLAMMLGVGSRCAGSMTTHAAFPSIRGACYTVTISETMHILCENESVFDQGEGPSHSAKI